MKVRDKGLFHPQMKKKGWIGRENDKCPKYDVFICSNIMNVGSTCGTSGGLLKKSCGHPSRRTGGLKTTPLHSCGKNLFRGGVYGARAPRKTSRHTLDESKRKGSMVSLKVHWNILKPIMAKCNEQFNVNLKSP